MPHHNPIAHSAFFAHLKPMSGPEKRAGMEVHSYTTPSVSGRLKLPPRITYQGSVAVGGGFKMAAKLRTACALGVFRSSTNSQTLPVMLRAWKGLSPTEKVVTGNSPACLSATFAWPGSASFPHGNVRPSVPRAAFSHSGAVGRRLPAHLANSCASTKVIPTIG